MNFLAHIYLSGDNDLIKMAILWLMGFGKQFKNYPLEVRKELYFIAIDTFADATCF
jgi:hypothetical protein